MPDLKLSKLPDRTPIKITIAVTPDLNKQLRAYAQLYRESYGEAEPVPELIPYMLQIFIESDRGYAKAVKDRQGHMATTEVAPIRRGRRRSSDPSESSMPKEI